MKKKYFKNNINYFKFYNKNKDNIVVINLKYCCNYIKNHKKDISYIRRTIKTIAQQLGIREKYGFKNYQLVDDEKKLINQVIEEVIADIKEYNITFIVR